MTDIWDKKISKIVITKLRRVTFLTEDCFRLRTWITPTGMEFTAAMILFFKWKFKRTISGPDPFTHLMKINIIDGPYYGLTKKSWAVAPLFGLVIFVLGSHNRICNPEILPALFIGILLLEKCIRMYSIGKKLTKLPFLQNSEKWNFRATP